MKSSELEKLIQDLTEGSISPQDLVSLEAELISNSESMACYLAYQDLNNLLEVRADIYRQQPSPAVPVELILHRQKTKTIRVAALSAVALLMLTMLVMQLIFVPKDEPILTFKTSPGTQLTLNHLDEEQTEATLKKGSQLNLTEGSIELTFESGVKSFIIAPAEITLRDTDVLYLGKGAGWFQVPENAIGFQVQTPDVLVTDLGTEFGVISSKSPLDEVHVFKGKVEVTNLKGKKIQKLLTTEQACLVDSYGELEPAMPRIDHFLTKLPDTYIPRIVFEDEFNSSDSHWTSHGNNDFTYGSYAENTCLIDTVDDGDHSDTHFNYAGVEIPASGDAFVALGTDGVVPTNSISTTIPVTSGNLYTIYFRYAGSHNHQQRVTATISLDGDSSSTGSLVAPDRSWASASFTFRPETSGNATLTFDDSGSSDDLRSDPLIDSILVTRSPNQTSTQ